jgi:N-acetyltransferase 10
MVRKKVDQRIRTLVENGVKLHHRSLYVIVGDKGRDQVRFSSETLEKVEDFCTQETEKRT